MSSPILRATALDGEVYDDPSEDLLYMLMEDLEAPGDTFIVERVEAGREGGSMRVLRQDDYFVLDGADAVGTPPVKSMRAVHAALTGWVFDLPGWQEALTNPPPSAL